MSVLQNNIASAIDTLTKSIASGPDPLMKSFVQNTNPTQGLQAYDLQAPALLLYPVLTPLRNSIPRVSGGYGAQANWKAITGINTANVRPGVGEGKRGGVVSHTTAEYFAAYRTLGLEDSVSFEAQNAAQTFDDLKARAQIGLLQAHFIGEERAILGGNTSVALGTTPTPTTSTATTGGTITAATYSVICVALGTQAYLDLAGFNNGYMGRVVSPATATIAGLITRTNADGTTDTFGDGSAQKSAAAAVTTTGATSTVSAAVAAVNGASGYAWFFGAAGSERLAAITSINSMVLTAPADAGAQLASTLAASDNSTSALEFDGLLTQAFKPNSGAYIKVMPTGTAGIGTGLTADGAGGIAEFEEAFLSFYNKYRMSPTVIYMSAVDLVNVSKKIIGNGGAPLIRLSVDATNPASISAGTVVGEYLNKVMQTKIKLLVHPNMPQGTVFFFSETIPYPLGGAQNVVQMKMRQDYHAIEWPLQSRSYKYGVYSDGVLQHYAPFSIGLITNIANA